MNKRTHTFNTPLGFSALAVALLLLGCKPAPQAASSVPAASAATSASDNVSDIDVTEHVKTALHQNELLKAFNIGVVTLKGDVRLGGELENQAQIDEAVKVARAAVGAHSVHNELTLKN